MTFKLIIKIINKATGWGKPANPNPRKINVYNPGPHGRSQNLKEDSLKPVATHSD